MALPDEEKLTAEDFYTRLRRTVPKIRECIEVDHSSFLEMLGMSAARYAEVAFRKSEYSTVEISSLADALSVDIDLLFQGKLDYRALAQQFRRNFSAVPERYADESQWLGRARAAQTIYSHLHISKGEAYARSYFRRFQLRPEAFSEATSYVHPLIAIDLMKDLSSEPLYDEARLRSMGTMNLAMLPAVVREKLEALKTPDVLYPYMFEEHLPKQYDRMFQYKLDRLTDSRCRIVVSTTEFTQNTFAGRNIDNRESCLFRQGVFSSFLGLIGSRFAQINEHSCVHCGGASCSFDVAWN